MRLHVPRSMQRPMRASCIQCTCNVNRSSGEPYIQVKTTHERLFGGRAEQNLTRSADFRDADVADNSVQLGRASGCLDANVCIDATKEVTFRSWAFTYASIDVLKHESDQRPPL